MTPFTSCHVCDRKPNARLQCLCPTCARNQLYPLRLNHAKVLLQKEAVGKEIEAAVVAKNTDDAEPTEEGKSDNSNPEQDSFRWAFQATKSRASQSAARTAAIRDHSSTLREEIKQKREDIARRKAVLKQRRSDIESATYKVADRRASALATVQKEIKNTEGLWNSLHNKTAQSRVFLCREVANLYRLRQRTRRKNGELVTVYTIGGVSIVDLRDLNGASHTHITTSLTYMAHLLVLVSHYLSLRLPAEITLPHRNYPLPTIFLPSSSYTSLETVFPGFSPSQSSSTSPTASRTNDSRPAPRPRPLYINKSLPKLVQKDPATYGLFLEGVTLLAWNVAWVCRTQGLPISFDSWQDVCDMGRNLWMLLVAQPSQVSALNRVLSTRENRAKSPGPSKDPTKPSLQRTKSLPIPGHYSHGTAHSFLGGADGTEFMRKNKLPSSVKVVDRLKSVLLGEIASAEWELLDRMEWEDDDTQKQVLKEVEGAVPVASKTPTAGSATSDTASFVTAKALDDDINADEDSTNNHNQRPKGTRGWTKLKNR
ncbi:hypothetical protein AJ79_08824 [Helicocarpus griseus UAMH5409]|uniref:Autophagy-related protein 14 n=1 Tax=Helicocarpus griseus UAMH5409 TaxID=1447875 RepID=A0A2B7WQ06_9EURO|nr:hypothetical protein AJ79_08824 [Helicocarpus griseus UAMH5409]